MNEKQMGKKALLADGMCLAVAAIWGTGFIASQLAIEANMSAALIMVLRFVAAALVMLLASCRKLRKITRQELKTGAVAGVLLFSAFYAQIVGQQNTTVSHCAFLTATNVVMVPFIVWALGKKRPEGRIFVLTALTLVGIGTLSFQPGQMELNFGFGDAMSLLCALLFALHITSLSWNTAETDASLVNLIQLSVAAVIAAAVFFLVDRDALARADLQVGLPAVLYLGLFSTCLCYFLQTLAQKYTSASHAGVLLSTEGLFGTGFSVAMGLEALTANLVIGGLIILASVILLETGSLKKKPADLADVRKS